MSALRTPRRFHALLPSLVLISFLTVSAVHADSTLTESPALGPAEHILPDAEGFRPELWSPDGNALVLTRDHRYIRILDTKSGLLWDVYSLTDPSPVRIPMAWDSTGAALRFLDYPAEAIRTYDLKSGALSAFHVRDPFLLREMWRGIEAPETRAIVWWDPVREWWSAFREGEGQGIKLVGTLSELQMDRTVFDFSGGWTADFRHRPSDLLGVGSREIRVGPLDNGLRHSRNINDDLGDTSRRIPGVLPTWEPGCTRLWYIAEDAGTEPGLHAYEPRLDWYERREHHTRSLGPLTGGQVLHIAIAPGGKRLAWLTASGIYTANIE